MSLVKNINPIGWFKAKLASAIGAAMVGISTGGNVEGVVGRTYSVMNYGAKGDGVTDDTAAIQAAYDAVPWYGTVVFPVPSVFYKVTNEIRITKPCTTVGFGGSTVVANTNPTRPCIKQTVPGRNIFKLVPSTAQYMFSPGVTGMVFRDLMLEGPDINNRAAYGICVDETVNAGVYHVRECNFWGVHMRYFDSGFRITGVVYLNNFWDCRTLWCGVGCYIDKVAGATEGGADQVRFFGCEFVLCDRGVNLSEQSFAGSITMVGCTMSEGLVGCVFGWNCSVHVSGCQIENNQYSGINISIPASVTNPNTESCKHIVGNCFLLNGNDIVIDKATTAYSGGGFAFPMLIEGNTFVVTKQYVLYVSAPTGAREFDSKQFRFSSTNGFSPVSGSGNIVGPVPDSMISDGWNGYNGMHEDGKVTLALRNVGNTWKNVARFTVPAGKRCYINYTMASVADDATGGNGAVSAGLRFTNASSGTIIKEDFSMGGTISIPRVNGDTVVVVATAANTATAAAVAQVSYCIM